ncbi:MAG: cysteine desulfurase [Candidatus Scalindua sp. AMX11]|nr:MAG: cysteine desulfurase [Candidatus Scalindua sp.]NOG82778.1 cysteine desulfurase [Planctomycetota bacterium]RZV95344.1 MAG: cysteine desulfurase [Candidatus Scalindua sp. SCAELEC01]TDE66173.1 MAG: cysteine desulfurase [Candidatus Scalindua sp. AMX11]GJQ57791.1 MAG: cysteine desulfurase [Candidatus Scalindua sp.]
MVVNDLNVGLLREDFPILKRKVHGKDFIYFDSAATSQKPSRVISTVEDFYRNQNANVHRGVYQMSEIATEKYENAHRKVARFINASDDREIVFVKSATEAINLVAYSWGRENIGPGDVILLTEMEHHSNLVPWQILAKEVGARLEFITVDDDGELNLAAIKKLIKGNLKLVAVTHLSNMLGTINPVKTIADFAHENGARMLVDAAQSVPHLPVDVQELNCDFLVFSGHKMLAPNGTGVLYAKESILGNMRPFLGGGNMIREVKLRDSTWNDIPWKFEAGTQAIAEGIALGVAIDYLEEIGMEKIKLYEGHLVELAMERLSGIDGLVMYGPPPLKRGGLISFTIRGFHPHEIAAALDYQGIAIRAGYHCAQPIHEKLGISASLRISFYFYNTEDEIGTLIEGLSSLIKGSSP